MLCRKMPMSKNSTGAPMMRQFLSSLLISVLILSLHAYGQTDDEEFRIRAKFRDSEGESIGNAEFRVKSRFGQVYYGGITRSDEFRFKVDLDAPWLFNRSIDVFIEDFFVDSLVVSDHGQVDTTFRSDFRIGDEPDRPLPMGFPDPIEVGFLVSVFDSDSDELLVSSPLEEEFLRGDVDQDGKSMKTTFHSCKPTLVVPGLAPRLAISRAIISATSAITTCFLRTGRRAMIHQSYPRSQLILRTMDS